MQISRYKTYKSSDTLYGWFINPHNHQSCCCCCFRKKRYKSSLLIYCINWFLLWHCCCLLCDVHIATPPTLQHTTTNFEVRHRVVSVLGIPSILSVQCAQKDSFWYAKYQMQCLWVACTVFTGLDPVAYNIVYYTNIFTLLIPTKLYFIILFSL
jgi:hypothetical protein